MRMLDSVYKNIEEEKKKYIEDLDILNSVTELDNLSKILIRLYSLNNYTLYYNLSCAFIRSFFSNSVTSIHINTKSISFIFEDFLQINIHFFTLGNEIKINVKVAYKYNSDIEKLFEITETSVEKKKSFAKEYLYLLENRGSLAEKLKLRFPNVGVFRRYFNYFTFGLWKDIKLNRGIDFYKGLVEEEEKRYEDFQTYFKNRQKNGLKQAKLFLTTYKQDLERVFNVEEITYMDIGKLVDIVKKEE